MKFYRYYQYSTQGTIRVALSEFVMIKETPKGYWIAYKEINPSEKKWVSKKARKRFAYPTKEQALQSFICRKNRQISILNNQLAAAAQAKRIAKNKLLNLMVESEE